MSQSTSRPQIAILKPSTFLIVGSLDNVRKLCKNTSQTAFSMLNIKALNHWAVALGTDCPQWLNDPSQGWAPAIAVNVDDATVIREAESRYEDRDAALLIQGEVAAVFQRTAQILREKFPKKYDSEIRIAGTYLEEFGSTHQIPKPISIQLQLVELRKQVNTLMVMMRNNQTSN